MKKSDLTTDLNGSAIVPVEAEVLEGEFEESLEERLQRCEAAIEEGARAFLRSAFALREVRDWKLYRVGPHNFATFEEYCKSHWGMSRPNAYRLIRCADVADNIHGMSPIGDIKCGERKIPVRESHFRALAKLEEPESQRWAWQLVMAATGDDPEQVTTGQVEEAVAAVRRGQDDPAPDAYSASAEPEPKEALSKKPPRRERIANDFYPTAAPLLTHLLPRIAEELQPGYRIFEPCAGDGVLIKVLRQQGYLQVEAGDIAPQFEPCLPFDATSREEWQERDEALGDKLWAQDWTITNPPFDRAAEILDNALRYSRLGVAFLLRLTFLEPCGDRADLLESSVDQLRWIVPCNPRLQAREDTKGTDNVTVAWFVWLNAWSWESQGLAAPFQFIRNWR